MIIMKKNRTIILGTNDVRYGDGASSSIFVAPPAIKRYYPETEGVKSSLHSQYRLKLVVRDLISTYLTSYVVVVIMDDVYCSLCILGKEGIG